MNTEGLVFQINKWEWFYLCCAKQSGETCAYGPFSSSLQAGSHLSATQNATSHRLVYLDQLKKFFGDELPEIMELINKSRAKPYASHPRKNYGF